jgi:hypothetical protein
MVAVYYCPSPEDLVFSKLAAGREKDFRFIQALLVRNLKAAAQIPLPQPILNALLTSTRRPGSSHRTEQTADHSASERKSGLAKADSSIALLLSKPNLLDSLNHLQGKFR